MKKIIAFCFTVLIVSGQLLILIPATGIVVGLIVDFFKGSS